MKEKINSLAVAYIETSSQAVFSEMYELLSAEWSRRIRRDTLFARTTEDEVLSAYHDVLLRVIDKYNPTKGNFVNMLNSAISNEIKDLRRKTKRRYWLEMYAEETEVNSAATLYDFRDERVDVENEALRRQKKRDQRQLISILVTAANDDLTNEIVRLFDSDTSYHALGKALGVRNETVKAKIERLARHFDANQFGRPSDYFAV